MRADQMIGLNERGRALILGMKCEVHETFEGAWNMMPLGAYVTVTPIRWVFFLPASSAKKTIHYTEFVQATQWSSGPCYFLALKDARGDVVEESLWTESEMDALL